MGKVSQLQKAIANLTDQIDVLVLARKHLIEQEPKVKPSRPRAVPKEDKTA